MGVDVDVAQLVDQDLLLEVAQGICRIPSFRPNEKPVAEYLARHLDRLGFEVELLDVVKDRPNLVAIIRGAPEYQSFLFNGHLDMPALVGGWQRDPFQPWIDDGILHGGGIQDMKGGIAALLASAAAVARARPERHGDIVVAFVMHHDTIGLGTKYFLASCPWRLDAGVCGEPTNLQIQLFHGGAWDFDIWTRGIPHHQSRLDEGVNAITGMMHILEQLRVEALTYTADPRYPFLPRLVIGSIAGGHHTAVTAEECVARGNIRYLPGMTIDGMKADLQQIVQRVCAATPGLSGGVRTTASQRPYEVAADEPVVQHLAAAHSQITGVRPAFSTGLPAGAFITDAADMVRHGIPTVLYGPAEWRLGPDEGVPIRDLVTAARVYAATCTAVISQPRRG